MLWNGGFRPVFRNFSEIVLFSLDTAETGGCSPLVLIDKKATRAGQIYACIGDRPWSSESWMGSD